MRFRFLAVSGITAAVLALSPVQATTYPPSPCTDGLPAETHGSSEINVTNPVTGGHVYTKQPGSTSGYAGTHSSTGYVEAYGDAATRSGAIEGQTSDGRVGGSVYGGRNGKTFGVCVTVNGTTINQGV